jgi:quercetin dioxygenase-like cupin family protein
MASNKASATPGRRGGLAPAQKQELSSLVSYQPGSVISRTIIDYKTGTVTLFAFDEGEGLSEHTAAFDALLYILEGKAAITIAGERNDLGEGEAIILPSGKPHSVKATTRFKMLLTMIKS